MQVGDLVDIVSGERKYLDAKEREAFKKAAAFMPPDIQSFCMMLYYTGCRLNEALAISPDRLDYDGQRVLIRTLKQNKNKPDKYRLVELPLDYLASLESDYKAQGKKGSRNGKKRLWSFTSRTGQNYVKKVMGAAGITGLRATPRGLRHSMGVMLAINKTPATVIADILGHEYIQSTEIYMQILGEDRRKVISQVW